MAWSQYSRLLHAHPLKTKALTSSFITGLSDVCLQLYENNSNERPSSKRQFSMAPDTATTSSSSRVCLRHGTYLQAPDLKWSRTLTLAAVGLIYSGPVNHLWFASLEKFVRIRHSGGAVATKLMLDQACLSQRSLRDICLSGACLSASLNLKFELSCRRKCQLPQRRLGSFGRWPISSPSVWCPSCIVYSSRTLVASSGTQGFP